MKKLIMKKIAVLLCASLVAGLTISNFSLAYANELISEIKDDIVDDTSDVKVSEIENLDMETLSESIRLDVASNSELLDSEDKEEDSVEDILKEYIEEPEQDLDDDSADDAADVDDEKDEAIISTESETEEESETTFIEEENDLINGADGLNGVEKASISEIDLIVEENVYATISEVDLIIDENITASTSETDRVVSNEEIASISEIEKSFLFGSVASPNETFKKSLGHVPVDIVFPEIDRSSMLFGGGPTLDASYDARTELNPANTSMSIVPPVRNQGNFGTCWAHSVIGMIETSIRKKGLVDNEDNSNLSEAALAYFYYDLDTIYSNSANMDKPGLEGQDYTKIPNASADPYNGNHWAQRGGNALPATLMSSSYVGAVIEDYDTKYENMTTGANITVNGIDGTYAYNKDAYVINNVKYINKNDRDVIKQSIMENGSVSISYYEEEFNAFNKVGDEYYYYTTRNNGSNHAVMAVGWDDNIPASYFTNNGNTPSIDGGWLIRNSWGPYTFDAGHIKDGYFWLSYDDKSISEDVMSADAIKADTYKYNYHYDTTGYLGYYPISSGEKIANVFKVSGGEDQVLNAISVALQSANNDFNIKIYKKDTEMSNPTDGTLAAEINNYTTLTAGIFVIPISTLVPLEKDTYFSIVIEANSSAAGDIYFWRDGNSASGASLIHNNMARKGQSYLYYYGSWRDQNSIVAGVEAKGSNFRIKALTNPALGVYFDANGGAGTMSFEPATSGVSMTLNANTFTKTGYKFDKWNTKADGSGDSYSDGASITITSATTLYAQWTPIHYTLRLNPNETGQSGTITGSETDKDVLYDKIATLSNPGFVSTTHTFDGWQTASGTGTKAYNENAEVKNLTTTDGSTVTLYAHWIPGSYKVIYNGHGATSGSMSNKTIAVGGSATLDNVAFTKTGYSFLHWSENEDGSGATYANGATYSKASAVKDQEYNIYAQWQANTYTIRYNANGGTITPASKTKTYDTALSLDTPTKEGYQFEGWYKESGLTNSYDGTTDLSSTQGATVDIYAKWTPITYTLTFNLQGVGATAPSDVTKTYASNVTLPSPTSVPSGYLFVGWYKETGCTNKYTGNSDLSTTQSDTITLYAGWKQQIIYDANGHGTAPAAVDVTTGNITLPNITCTGYTFGGWYGEAGCSTFIGNAGETYTVSGPKTLYAKWTANTYTINYNANGGTITPTSKTKTYDTAVTLDTPTKDGYTFAGWYKETGLTNSYDGTTDLSSTQGATVTIYAKWAPITYTITYDVGGHATAPANATKTYATNLTLSNPTNIEIGYTFAGWYSDASLNTSYNGTTDLTTTAGETKTIYAKWKARVTYNTNGHGTVSPGYVDVVIGENTTLPTLTDVTAYKFDLTDSWYAEAGCTTKVGSANGSYTVTEPKTLYAKWNEITYTLILDPNTSGQDGRVTGSAQTFTNKSYSEDIVLANSVPFTSTTHSFGGWSKVSGANNAKAYDEGATVNKLTTTDGATVTLYAKWVPGAYKVVFDGNGATSGSMGMQTITIGQSAALTANAYSRVGYTFIGWATTSNADVSYADRAIFNKLDAVKDQEYTLYAKWQANNYTNTYMTNGGSWVSPFTPVTTRSYEESTTLPTSAEIERIGYTFEGWYEESTFVNAITTIPANLPSHKTVFAKWSENTYNITLHENGGTYASTYIVPATRLYTESTTLPTSANVSKTGYTFEGWYEDSGFSGSKITTIPANTASDKEYWLKWNENTYTITYNTNGGTWGAALTDADTKRLYTEGKTLKTDITKAGHTFAGWYQTTDFSDEASTNISANTVGNKIYYAKWNINTYTVTYDTMGGNIIPSQSVQYNQKATKPTDPTKISAVFKYWYKYITGDPSEENTPYDFNALITDHTVLRAKWESAWVVTFDMDGATGTAPASQNIINGNKATKPANPTADGKRFVRWYKDGESDAVDFDFNTAITENITLKAKWADIVTYQVTFNMNGVSAEAIPTQYVEENTKAVSPTIPTHEGYTFVRWYTTDENVAYDFNTIVTANIELKAKWNEKSFTIAYNLNGGTFTTAPTEADTKRLYTESKTLKNDVNRDGFTFDGWYEDSNFIGFSVTSIPANTASNKTYYAKWTIVAGNKLVSFNSNGGTSVQALSITSGATITAPTSPTKSGYTFAGWFTDVELTHQFDFTTAITEAIILYAKWNQNYTPEPIQKRHRISRNSSGGSGGSSGGIISKRVLQQAEIPSQEAAKLLASSVIKASLSSENVVWTYDAVQNKWSLSIDKNKPMMLAMNGFYTIATIDKSSGQVKNDVYSFDANGDMITGWVKDNTGSLYYFNQMKNNDEGKMSIGWNEISKGVWYYFASDGKLLVNATAPDGTVVGADGSWHDPNVNK